MIFSRIYAVRWLLAPVLLLAAAGCAKAPSNSGAGLGTQLVITMTVAGQIESDYFYYVLFNVNNTTGQGGLTGPVPVVAPPYYNGFAVGAFSSYLEYNGSLPNDGYELFSIASNLQTTQALGQPLNHTPVSEAGNTISFRIALSQIAGAAGVSVADVQNIEVNFITTNAVPVASDTAISKNFDALGNPFSSGVNDFLTITNLTQANTINNSSSATPETSGDVAAANGDGSFGHVNDPNLDITDYSIQIVD